MGDGTPARPPLTFGMLLAALTALSRDWQSYVLLRRFTHGLSAGLPTVQSGGTLGYLVGSIPGEVVASCAIMAGVFSEAAYALFSARPVVARPLRPASDTRGRRRTFRSLLLFYVPLSLTPLLGLLVQPIGSAAMSAAAMLRTFARWLSVASTGLLLIVLNPGELVSGAHCRQPANPRNHGSRGARPGGDLPGSVRGGGVGALTGIYATMAAFTLGEAVRTAWLRHRSRVAWMARTVGEASS